MAFIDEFKDLLKETVTISPWVSQDAYGAVTYGMPVSYKARIGHSNKIFRGAEGQEIVAQAKVWLGATNVVSTKDRITMPDGTTPPIISTERFFDESGPSHTVLYLG